LSPGAGFSIPKFCRTLLTPSKYLVLLNFPLDVASLQCRTEHETDAKKWGKSGDFDHHLFRRRYCPARPEP